MTSAPILLQINGSINQFTCSYYNYYAIESKGVTRNDVIYNAVISETSQSGGARLFKDLAQLYCCVYKTLRNLVSRLFLLSDPHFFLLKKISPLNINYSYLLSFFATASAILLFTYVCACMQKEGLLYGINIGVSYDYLADSLFFQNFFTKLADYNNNYLADQSRSSTSHTNIHASLAEFNFNLAVLSHICQSAKLKFSANIIFMSYGR